MCRQGILEDIATKLHKAKTCSKIAVTGVGGFGKTTIVTALCDHPLIKEKFTCGVLFVELGLQVVNPVIKLNEIYLELSGKNNKNINNAEAEIKKIVKNSFQNLLVIIDDIWYIEDAQPIVNAFDNCHIVFTTRRNDIAELFKAEYVVKVDQMTMDEAVELLTNKLFDLNNLSSVELNLLEKLADDAHKWPVLLALIRGQLHHHVLNLSNKEAIKSVQKMLQSKGLTAFDKNNADLVKKSRTKSIHICIKTTLELLTESTLNKYITLILFIGIGGHIIKDILHALWNVPTQEAQEVASTLSIYGLISITCPRMLHIKSELVATHSVISQFTIEHIIRSDQVANLSPFAILSTDKLIFKELSSLFKSSYGVQKVAELQTKENLAYNMHKIEQVIIPFQLKNITSHLLHDPHVILLMLERIQSMIYSTKDDVKIIIEVVEQMVKIESDCKNLLKTSLVEDRIINSKVQKFLSLNNYTALACILEEKCTPSFIGEIAQNCIKMIYKIIPRCKSSSKQDFNGIIQMFQKLTPEYHSINQEKLPALREYIKLHKDISTALETGSSEELHKIYVYIASGKLNKNLDLISDKYLIKIHKIAPDILSKTTVMYKTRY